MTTLMVWLAGYMYYLGYAAEFDVEFEGGEKASLVLWTLGIALVVTFFIWPYLLGKEVREHHLAATKTAEESDAPSNEDGAAAS